ncbi:MAG: nitroreductase family protein [Syntrophobacteraceae bacterium]
MSDSPVIKAIYERRSVRQFLDGAVPRDCVMEALRAACWAPSGLNNQPWRFAIIWDAQAKDALGALTRYSETIKTAAVLVVVLLDRDASYERTKDCQAIGACVQNLLLAFHAMDLGAVWIGEILKNGERVIDILKLPDRMELMAVVAVGLPAHRNQKSHRRPVEELIVLEK